MKGILFKPDMIPAIVDGRKTQTRRVIKPQPIPFHPKNYPWKTWYDFGSSKPSLRGCLTLEEIPSHSPYKVGETVYIKEAHYRYGVWRKNGLTKAGRQRWEFKALSTFATRVPICPSNTIRYYDNPPDEVQPNSYRKVAWYKRSPLFMPEWAARHFITILHVRAARLQEITEEDVLAEGITVMRGTWQSKKWNEKTRRLELTGEQHPYTGRYHFEVIWNSLNPKYPFESNPWVFPYEFELVKE